MNRKSIFYISFCIVICSYGVRAEEMGGFFVEIEPGQSNDYPQHWEEQPQTSQEIILEEPGYSLSEEQSFEQNTESLPPASYIYFPIEDPPVYTQPSVFMYQETILPTVMPVPTLMSTEIPVPTQSPIPSVTPEPTVTEKPTVTSIPTATPIPVLSASPALERKTRKEFQEEKLKACYFSTTMWGEEKDLKTLQIKLRSQNPVYVWSVRINKQEQKWSWKKGQTIVIEDVEKSIKYNLELLSFCEKKDKIQVFVDDKIK